MEELEMLVTGPLGYGVAFVLGALFGSFGNVCIYRIPAGKSILQPPSHCYACKTPLAWYDNFPIVSYFVLGGKCRTCKAPYSARYMLVEVAMGILAVALWHLCIYQLHPGEPYEHRLARFGIYFLFTFVLVVLAFIDFDVKRIPDKITYPGIPTFFLFALLLGDLPWKTTLIGAALGYGIVRLISDGYWYLFKREGMGYGDGKLLALMGALLGWQIVLFALFLGSLLGSIIGVTALLLVRRNPAEPAPAPVPESFPAESAERSPEPSPEAPVEVPLRHVELPFGPFLIAAAVIFLFAQGPIYVAFETLLEPFQLITG